MRWGKEASQPAGRAGMWINFPGAFALCAKVGPSYQRRLEQHCSKAVQSCSPCAPAVVIKKGVGKARLDDGANGPEP